MPQPLKIKTQDGCEIHGFEWRLAPLASFALLSSSVENKPRDVVIINPATSVQCRYYFRFAQYLFDQGFDVVTYDYRGVGASKPKSLRGFKASWVIWGEQDFEAVLQNTTKRFPQQKILVVGHSIGGVLIGLAPSNHLISRVFSMGSQQAYWRDYLPANKFTMVIKWHILMPLIAISLGYLPAKRLGWMEDTPKHVALDWATMGQHLIPSIVKSAYHQHVIRLRFAQMKAQILAFGADDDPFGTAVALNRLLDLYVSSDRYHLRLNPISINHPTVGHFSFFNDRFKETLWLISLNWLQKGIVLPQPGFTVKRILAFETAMR